MFIRFITTGGTIDKIYFDALSRFEVGDSQVRHILTEGLVDFDYEIVAPFKKDSLDITDADRRMLHELIANDDGRYYVVTHGTDTMVETADVLADIEGKTIVLTGALSPARDNVASWRVMSARSSADRPRLRAKRCRRTARLPSISVTATGISSRSRSRLRTWRGVSPSSTPLRSLPSASTARTAIVSLKTIMKRWPGP